MNYMYKEIISVCKVRTASGLSCRECYYKGRLCDTFCAKYNIDKPANYNKGGYNNGYKQEQGKGS